MESVIEKLEEILNEYEGKKDSITSEERRDLLNREFDLFSHIHTIKEYAEYVKTDLTINGCSNDCVYNMYSGIINGGMFVVTAMLDILHENKSENDDIKRVKERLLTIQGLTEDGE